MAPTYGRRTGGQRTGFCRGCCSSSNRSSRVTSSAHANARFPSEESNPAMLCRVGKGPRLGNSSPRTRLYSARRNNTSPCLTGSRRSSRAPSKRCQPAPADRAVIAICHPSASSRARSVRAHARRTGSTTGPRARKQARGTRRTYAVPNLRISCFAGISLPHVPTLIRRSHGGARLIIGRSQPQPRQR
jgi:hypothetical protein